MANKKNSEIKGHKKTVSKSIQCDSDIAEGVKTRSMIKKDVEKPRNIQSESDSILFSPETVSCNSNSPLLCDSPGLVTCSPVLESPVNELTSIPSGMENINSGMSKYCESMDSDHCHDQLCYSEGSVSDSDCPTDFESSSLGVCG